MATKKREVTAEIVPHESVGAVKGGTAQVEPQFKVDRHGALLCRANSYEKLHEALYQAEELEESMTQVKLRLACYPLDGIVAINRALDRVYGFTHAKGEFTFFGWVPPIRVNIQTSFDKSETFAYGKLNPPAWESGWIEMQVDPKDPMSIMITGQMKRKFEPQIKGVVALAQKLVKEESIYRGAAVELDLDYIEGVKEGDGFNPETCAPQFIDTRSEPILILPRDIEFELENDIWGVIENPGAYRQNGVPTKIGVLLSGPPGTGKTLTAAYTAYKAAECGYTYFFLKTPHNFVEGYKLAQIYQPSVLFVEDIDQIFSGKRTPEMNAYLETMDGVTSKQSQVITVFTSNYPEKINDAFMRRGRLDNHIKLRALDSEAAGRFIQTFCGHELAPDVDYAAVGVAFRDLVPSDIRGGVYKAKKQAIKRLGADIHGKVTTEMLEDAGEVMRRLSSSSGEDENEDARNLKVVRAAHRIVSTDGQVAAK